MQLYQNAMDMRLEKLFSCLVRSAAKGYIEWEEVDKGMEIIVDYQKKVTELSEEDIEQINILEDKYNKIEDNGDGRLHHDDNKNIDMLCEVDLLKNRILNNVRIGFYSTKEVGAELSEIEQLEKKYSNFRYPEDGDIEKMNKIIKSLL